MWFYSLSNLVTSHNGASISSRVKNVDNASDSIWIQSDTPSVRGSVGYFYDRLPATGVTYNISITAESGFVYQSVLANKGIISLCPRVEDVTSPR